MSAVNHSTLHRAAAAACRERSPQWFYAAHLLPKAQRADVLTLRAVLGQLHDIMFAEEDAGGCCQSRPAGPHQVCHAVLDHLWSGEPTGKDELDGFADVQRRHDLPRERFDRTINGWQALRKLPRIATWSRFRDLHERATAPMVDLMLQIVGVRLEGTARRQAESIALAMSMAHVLAGLPEALKRGVVPLPLDDLMRHGVSDRQLLDWAAQKQPGDQRWRELVSHEVQRALVLLRGGGKAGSAIASPTARRSLAVLVRTYEMCLATLAQHAEQLPVQSVTLSRWQRMRAMTAVYGVRQSGKRGAVIEQRAHAEEKEARRPA